MKQKFLALFLFLSVAALAQDKMLTIENTVFAGRDGLTPQRLPQLGWIKGSENYYYIDRSNETETLVMSKGDGKSSSPVLTLSELNDQLQKTKAAIPALKSFPVVNWLSPQVFTFTVDKWLFTYLVSGKQLTVTSLAGLPQDADHFDESPVSKYTAYTVANNLYITKTLPGSGDKPEVIAVTSDADVNIVNGQSVHREEFGIVKGTFWSPSGMQLAFYRMDQTMVTDYPILDLTKQPAQARMIKYPMAGGTSHQVTVGVYNVTTGKTVFLQTGEPKEQYLTNIAWSPDNQHVYIAVLNRDQNHLWLNSYNATTGAFEKTLFEETDSKYVHPMHAMEFVPGHNDQFIWQRQLVSENNPEGFNAIYLYSIDGKLLKQLSGTGSTGTTPTGKAVSGEEVTDIYGFDPTGRFLYYQSAPYNTCEKQLRMVDVKTGAITALTTARGTHTAIFSESKKYFIDQYSAVDVPMVQSVCDAKGKQVRVLSTSADPLTEYKKCGVRLFTITAADGKTPLWCRMFLPAGFDSTKKYPSLTYVYNGPNVQLVTNSWLAGADLFLYYMAQQGFVVFTVDGRGSANRGMLFEQATFRHLGTNEINDQEKGNNYLRSLSYVDAARMAVYGWSFGGFMTTSLMTRKAGMYKCGVAGGAVIDWSYYEVMYTERYMDTPQANPVGYKESNLVNYVQNLKGKLLMIHGTSDDVVVWQHTLMYTKACVDKGVQTDYYMYPGHLHNVRGKDRVHLLTKISQYVIANT